LEFEGSQIEIRKFSGFWKDGQGAHLFAGSRQFGVVPEHQDSASALEGAKAAALCVGKAVLAGVSPFGGGCVFYAGNTKFKEVSGWQRAL
jgi:hypothetical protein